MFKHNGFSSSCIAYPTQLLMKLITSSARLFRNSLKFFQKISYKKLLILFWISTRLREKLMNLQNTN